MNKKTDNNNPQNTTGLFAEDFNGRSPRFRKPSKPLITTWRARLLSAATLALTFLSASPTANASLLAYEGFNYSSGTGNLSGQSGGFGWNGSWQTVVNGSSSVLGGSLVAGGRAPSGYDSHSIGKAAFTPNGTRTGRLLDTSAGGVFGAGGYINGSGNIGAAGKTIYISFLQQPNIANNNFYEFEIHRGDLNDSGRIGGVGCDTGGSSSVYLRTPAAAQTLIGPASTSVDFYVVRIDFLGGNDTVRVYQNPTSLTEPGTPTLTETSAGDMSFNGISFGAFVNGATVAHDEVRLGQTWADVVGSAVFSSGNWTGAGSNACWSTGSNWDNSVVPIFPISLTFAGSSRLTNTNDLTGVSANAITFDAAAGTFNLNGNALGLNGNISFNGNPTALTTQTINLPLGPTTNFTVDLRTNGNITINGNVTGTNSTLTQTSGGNAGVLNLAGTNSLAGFIINGGTNRITGNTTISGTGGTQFYLANGSSSFNSTLIIESGAYLNLTGNFSDAGVIGRNSGVGTVIQNGGTFSFNIPNNPYLFVSAGNSTNTYGTYDMKGGLLNMNGNTLGISLGSGASVTGLVNQVSGIITNVGQLYFSAFFTQGHGIYNLTGGSIYIGSGGITNFTGSSYEIYLGGGTVGALANWSSAMNMTLTGTNGSVTFNPGGGTITLSGILSGAGGLAASGGGILELSGANTYAGDTTINAGTTLQLDNTGSSTGAFRIANGGALNLNFSGNFAIGGLYTNGVAVPVGNYNSGSLPGYIIGSGTLQVTKGISSGLWTGNGGNNNWSTPGNWDNNAVPIFPRSVTFSGNTRLTNNNDLSNITVSSLTFGQAAGAYNLGGNSVTLSGNIGFSGTPSNTVNQTVNFSMTFTGDQTISLPTNGNLSLGGSIFSGYNFLQTGSGTLTLGGASDSFSGFSVDGGTNVITGDVEVTGTGSSLLYIGDVGTTGTLILQPGSTLSVSGSLGDAGVIGRNSGTGIVVQNGGTFSFNPANVGAFYVGASSSSATRAEYDMHGGFWDMNGNTLGVALAAGGGTHISSVVNQTGGTIANVDTLDLGALTLGPGHGVFSMNGGTIEIGGGGIISDSGSYEIYLGGGTVGSYNSWVSSLNMTLTGSNGPVTFDTSGNSINLTGILSGSGGLKVVGGGVLELGGVNLITGDMNVNAGTLQFDVTGSSPGALRMTNGTTLNLNFSGNYFVAAFFTNGVRLPSGTYNAANLPGYITGSGNLVVQGVSTGHWTGAGANNNWSTAGNWDGNTVPIFPIGLTFGGNSRLNNSNDLNTVTAAGIIFSNTAGAFTLNGNALGLSGNISFSGNPATPITQAVHMPLSLTANITVDTPSNATLILDGDVTAPTNALAKLDAGTLMLDGTNLLAAFEVDGGTNILGGTTTVTGTGNSRVYVANGDSLPGSVGTLVIPNGSTFTINSNFADAFVIGRDTGQGRLIQNGGQFNFAPSNQFMIVGAGNNASTRGEYDMNGGVLDMNGNTLGVGLGVNVLVTGIVNQSSGVITNVGQLYLDTFFSSGHGIYNMTGGSLYIGSGGIIVQSGGTYELYFGGGTVVAETNWSSLLNITITGTNGPTVFNTASNTIDLAGPLSGPGGLIVSGGGILELSGANNYAGDSTVNAGSTLQLDTTGSCSAAIRLANNAMLNLNYIGTAVVPNLYTNSVALPRGTYNSSSLASFITGTGSIQVGGSIPNTPTNITATESSGKLTLSWPASYTGWILQAQTNSVNGTNWVDIPGSQNMNATNIQINPAVPRVFYRLRYP